MTPRRRRIAITAADLATIEVLAGLDQAALEQLAAKCRGYEYDKGYQLMDFGDESRDVYLLIDGVARVNVFTPEGDPVTYELLYAGAMFGEIAAIDGQPRSAGVVVEETARIATINEREFFDLVESEPTFAVRVMERLAWMARWLATRLYDHYSQTVEGRLATELLRLGEGDVREDGTMRIAPPPTHGDFASRVGAERAYISRMLSQFVRDGLISTSRSEIIILDPEGLRRRRSG